MRTLFLILIFLHALIHSLGFVKAFGLYEVKELALPISKPRGLLWLAATLLFLLYGLVYFLNNSYAWAVGLAAVILSQTLIIVFWPDAKFATVPNIIIFLVVLFSYGNTMFESKIAKEKKEILEKRYTAGPEVFSERDIEGLPTPVKKWLMNSGATGRPKTLNGTISQRAQMKMKPEQEEWYPATALQYTVVEEPAFLWTVDLKINPFLWVRGRDKFQDGKGAMLIKMNSLINVVNETGEKINEGSLQRFLGEMVWFPSLAVSPYVTWQEKDALSAEATMAYKGTSGSGTFYFNEAGEFVKFVAPRFQGNAPDAERREWILTVKDYRVFDGIKVPSKMEAAWNLDTGNWTWLRLEITAMEYNIDSNHTF